VASSLLLSTRSLPQCKRQSDVCVVGESIRDWDEMDLVPTSDSCVALVEARV
jgi:hypothetical protein